MRNFKLLIISAVGAACFAHRASGAESSSWQLDLGRALAVCAAHQAEPELEDEAKDAVNAPRYGEKNSLRWYVQGAGAFDVEGVDTRFALLGGGISYYVVDNLAFLVELNGLYFNQPGLDAQGVNFGVLFRWHFLARDTWSMYLEAGAGMLGTTERVPSPNEKEPRGGTKFNFTPQFGGGLSWQIMENTRLLTGVRWFHISNARTQDNNPGLDSIMLYVGASLSF